MNIEDLKKAYGTEYPAAVVTDGVRLTLSRETRFSRSYYSPEYKMGSEISKFMDGSASITLPELEREWPQWTEEEWMDFCSASAWLDQQSDFPDMLRFVMQRGGPEVWSAVALSVACQLPQDEAFNTLLRALHSMKIGRKSNIAQAIAKTKHPKAEEALREQLQSTWAHASMWDDDKFVNWVAFDATTCITHLIELGVTPAEFDERVRQLSRHVSSHNRDSCRNFLGKYYNWLR